MLSSNDREINGKYRDVSEDIKNFMRCEHYKKQI